MDGRRSEKLGWTLGGLGGSLWMIPVSMILLGSGRIASGFGGLCLFALAVAAIAYLAPWKHPRVEYWKLLVPCCLIVGLAAILLLGLEGSPYVRRFLWSQSLLLVVFSSPLSPVGRLRWQDREPPIAVIPPAPATTVMDAPGVPSNGT